MNDKEWLEEIIFIKQEAKRYLRNNDLFHYLAALKIIHKKGYLNRLIEQAQREDFSKNKEMLTGGCI